MAISFSVTCAVTANFGTSWGRQAIAARIRVVSSSAARAGANGSWCANYGTGHSGINCSYTSQQQCLASVSGVYGFCTPNPYPGTGYGTGGAWNLTPTGRARTNRVER